MSEPLRALIVEDVALARAALVRLLAPHRGIELVGTAASVQEAEALRAGQKIDLAFLDIRLPDGSGIDLAKTWPDPAPQFVFITANPEFAVDAFALDAQDYLLKPITPAGLDRALARVWRRHREAVVAPAVPQPIEVRDGSRTSWIDPALIDYVDVAGHYLCLHVGREIHLLRRPIAELTELLGSGFARVHRSAIVRLDRVRAVSERRNGDADIELEGGASLRMSRSYRPDFDRLKAALRG